MATAEDVISTTGIAHHGAKRLPSVDVDSYNIELKDDEGFLGDRASKGAFREIFERWRRLSRESGQDPFGDEPSETIDKKVLDAALINAAQAAEHYEIVRYGSLIAWARQLGRNDCASVLQKTLDEEKATDQKLTALAEGKVNLRAAS